LFGIGWSWGGVHSLAMPYEIREMRSATAWPYQGTLVRFFIGLEDVGDLQADIEHSLNTHLIA